MIIHPTGRKQWSPKHETFTQDIENLYDLANHDTGNPLNDYNSTTAGISKIIEEAIQKGLRLRAIGGEWSFTKITATDGIILNTKPLNLTFRIKPSSIDTHYAKTAEDLYFAQCGVSVLELNEALRKRNRSIMTSGASNGQTIVGALSTGTHGSAFDIGAIPDFVVGLHIIVSPTRHVWLERDSYPVTSPAFADKIQAELIRDDEQFDAALVSFGSCGFIHGVMIETSPLFLYECYRERMPLDSALLNLMETLDFSDALLPHGTERPYHFQVVLNQYDMKEGAYVTTLYKRPFDAQYISPAVSIPGIIPGDDLPSIIGKLTQMVPASVAFIVNQLISTQYKPFGKDVWGTHSEIFSNSDVHGKVLSAAVGVPLSKVLQVKEVFLSLNRTHGPFAGVIAFRYVKGTTATLGFTRFQPTCVIELDAVFSDHTLDFCNLLWNTIEALDIPFTFHWGKVLDLNKVRIRKMYTDAIIEAWITARNKLMQEPASMNVFTNDTMVEWGLDTIVDFAHPV
jgi:FAD/FMN-containing dehydrogenase